MRLQGQKSSVEIRVFPFGVQGWCSAIKEFLPKDIIRRTEITTRLLKLEIGKELLR